LSAVKRLCVLGHPVAHSRSPQIHTAAFRALGIEDEWSYEAIDVATGDFADRVGSLAGEGFVGANVTIPHKEAALALADEASDEALAIGAANTLILDPQRIGAHNTDGEGLVSALPEPAQGKRALVLGAGGAARAAVFALAREGAQVRVWNRTAERAASLADELHVEAVDADGARAGHDLIVNATAVGLAGQGGLDELPVGPDELGGQSIVVDLVYGDRETELCRLARERGAAVVDGLDVLARQAAGSFRIWTGREAPLDEMLAAARV
jgi:shikimate dehydrogenase